MKKLIDKIDNASDLDKKIRLLENLRRVINFYLKTYRKQRL